MEGGVAERMFVPHRLADRLHVAASHKRAVPSLLAVAMRVPSGLNMPRTTSSSCRMGSPTGAPVVASHKRAVLSALAVRMRRPSGLKARRESLPPAAAQARAPCCDHLRHKRPHSIIAAPPRNFADLAGERARDTPCLHATRLCERAAPLSRDPTRSRGADGLLVGLRPASLAPGEPHSRLA